MLGACVKCGDEIELICEGADEKEALEAITELINGGLWRVGCMLVYVSVTALPCFLHSRPFYLIRNVADVCSTISLSVGIWEKRAIRFISADCFPCFMWEEKESLPEAVKPSEGLEFRDLGVLFCSFCGILECVRTGRKEIWIWERKKDCGWFFSEVYREGCREIRDKNFHCTYRHDQSCP